MWWTLNMPHPTGLTKALYVYPPNHVRWYNARNKILAYSFISYETYQSPCVFTYFGCRTIVFPSNVKQNTASRVQVSARYYGHTCKVTWKEPKEHKPLFPIDLWDIWVGSVFPNTHDLLLKFGRLYHKSENDDIRDLIVIVVNFFIIEYCVLVIGRAPVVSNDVI
jgi:hypothetical protein